MSSPHTVALMGSQRLKPRVKELAHSMGAAGPFAIITAGWQEREREDEELRAHLGGEAVNLALGERVERVLAQDTELAGALRARQEMLRHLQRVYRIRLRHAFDAELDVRTYGAPEALRSEIEDDSIEAIRALDETHLGQCRRLREEFEDKWRPQKRRSLEAETEKVHEALESCGTVLIAGGHVAVLMNRMELFDLGGLLREKPVIGWSAGAMVLTQRIVLFHDDAPQGGLLREVLDQGLGLVEDMVVFPEPERRLEVENRARTTHMLKRFAPAQCVLLPESSHVVIRGGRKLEMAGAEALPGVERP
ncbi:MAG: Type 1 glutamine amidotransferase-like domain-containing protein [Myxococcota bacterium]